MIQRIAEDLFTWLNLVGNTMPPRHPISQTMMMMTRRKMTTRSAARQREYRRVDTADHAPQPLFQSEGHLSRGKPVRKQRGIAEFA